MIDKIHDQEHRKAVENLDYLKLGLNNLKLGFKRLNCDLPLYCLDSRLEDRFGQLIAEIEEIVEIYEKKIE